MHDFGYTVPIMTILVFGGTGLIGMWKAFGELEELGWLSSGKRPKMVSCQSDGCAPIVKAFESGERHAKRVDNAITIASGLRVPQAVGDFMILDAVNESERLRDKNFQKEEISGDEVPIKTEEIKVKKKKRFFFF